VQGDLAEGVGGRKFSSEERGFAETPCVGGGAEADARCDKRRVGVLKDIDFDI
jgi:hypothetical protein